MAQIVGKQSNSQGLEKQGNTFCWGVDIFWLMLFVKCINEKKFSNVIRTQPFPCAW